MLHDTKNNTHTTNFPFIVFGCVCDCAKIIIFKPKYWNETHQKMGLSQGFTRFYCVYRQFRTIKTNTTMSWFLTLVGVTVTPEHFPERLSFFISSWCFFFFWWNNKHSTEPETISIVSLHVILGKCRSKCWNNVVYRANDAREKFKWHYRCKINAFRWFAIS